jgi:hypothetical protein
MRACLVPVALGLLALLAACGPGVSGADARAGKRFFTTSDTYDALGIGAIEGADTKCNHAALSADLGGTWVAWLSDSSVDAIDRIPDVGPWYLVNGYTVVFHSKAHLEGNPVAHLAMDESGTTVGQGGQGRYVWTGTALGGVKGTHCSDWTDNSVANSATIGDLQSTEQAWTESIEPLQNSCNLFHRLYCFEQ